MIISPETALGKCRLICGDVQDIVLLPDSVYLTTLSENNQNVDRSSTICATYILALLAHSSTHQRLNYIEIHGNQAFEQYLKFLTHIIKNPSFSRAVLSPYSGSTTATDAYGKVASEHALIRFIRDWNSSFVPLTQSDAMHEIAGASV